MNTSDLNTDSLLDYLRTTGTGLSKLQTISEVLSECETVEQFLEQIKLELSQATITKIETYLAHLPRKAVSAPVSVVKPEVEVKPETVEPVVSSEADKATKPMRGNRR